MENTVAATERTAMFIAAYFEGVKTRGILEISITVVCAVLLMTALGLLALRGKVRKYLKENGASEKITQNVIAMQGVALSVVVVVMGIIGAYELWRFQNYTTAMDGHAKAYIEVQEEELKDMLGAVKIAQETLSKIVTHLSEPTQNMTGK